MTYNSEQKQLGMPPGGSQPEFPVGSPRQHKTPWERLLSKRTNGSKASSNQKFTTASRNWLLKQFSWSSQVTVLGERFLCMNELLSSQNSYHRDSTFPLWFNSFEELPYSWLGIFSLLVDGQILSFLFLLYF